MASDPKIEEIAAALIEAAMPLGVVLHSRTARKLARATYEVMTDGDPMRLAERQIIDAIEAQFDIHAMEPEDFAEMWVAISNALRDFAASADTHPKGGDVKQAPAPLSGAVPHEDAADAHTAPDTSHKRMGE